MSAQPIQVLLVEDNATDARYLRELLNAPESLHTQCTHCVSLAEAVLQLSAAPSHVVLLDLDLPDATGLAAVRKLRAVAQQSALVVLTGLDDERAAMQALTAGAQDYLVKGQIGAQALLRAMRHAIERQRLQVASDEARELQLQRRNEFISMVSHELRTPLTSIRGALGLVNAGAMGQLPEKAKAMVQIAHQNSERLGRIVNDILDIEKINCGGMELRPAPVAIAEFLEQALAVNQVYGVKYQVRFELESAPPQALLTADPDRLMQVMANLLSNAAKFSAPGSLVRVRASEHDALVRVEVQDHGTGIPESFRPRVFEKFAQADLSSSRHSEGSGLGLSITRRLLEAMHGSIGFSSISGQGTTFYFELPRAGRTVRRRTVQRDAPALAPPACLPCILHVEDDGELSQVIEAALAGHAVLVSARTLQAAETLLSQESFALLLLDLSLSDGNGLSLIDRLPALTSQAPPVVLLCATDVPHDVQQTVAATLVKSRVSEAHVVKTIRSWLP